MKSIFNWSFVVSALTIYFYWYGYWYTEGYYRFFSQDIKAYDIPLQHIIMAGVFQSVTVVLVIILLLIVLLFFLQFSKNQKLYFFNIVQVCLLYVFIAVYLFFKIFFIDPIGGFKKIKSKESDNRLSTERKIGDSKNIIENKCNRLIKKYIQPDSLPGFKKEKDTLKRQREVLDERIKQEDNTSFDIQSLIYTVIVLSIFAFILSSLSYALQVNKKGFDDASHAFKCSIDAKAEECEGDSYSEIFLSDIPVQNDDSTNNTENNNNVPKWYLTHICLNGGCLVFNENKRAKFIDITDKDIVIGEN